MLNVNHFLFRVKPDDVQRNQGVLHPESIVPLIVIDKKHTFILRECLSIHQPSAFLGRGVGYLNPDYHALDLDWQFAAVIRFWIEDYCEDQEDSQQEPIFFLVKTAERAAFFRRQKFYNLFDQVHHR